MAMSMLEFETQVEKTLSAIDEALDDFKVDVDSELADGMLTLTCENGSAIIFSRQRSAQELWLAARNGAYHFRFDENAQQWLCTKTSESLANILERVFIDQAGAALPVSI